ncbi:CBS domain-containing protein [Nesterenkonia sandarakina]|nr:CBS domain-containing protein [Nesterenkonia sandarakina]
MDPRPERLLIDASLTEVASALQRTGHEALPLCDTGGEFLGVVAQSELDRVLASMGDLAYSLRAQHLMRTTAPVVSTETTVEEALNLMATHQVEYAPVIQGRVLRGMLTSAAIARAESSAVISELTEHSQNTGTLQNTQPSGHAELLASTELRELTASTEGETATPAMTGPVADPGESTDRLGLSAA